MKACFYRLLLSTVMLFTALPSQAEQANPGLVLQNAPATSQSPYPADVYDIYGPLPLPDPINWLPYIIAGSLLLIIILLLFFLFMRKKKKSAIPLVPPHVTALAELELARKYLVNNQSLTYAERISEILRRYIEQRYTITSTRQTTAEFLHSIETATNGSNLLSHKDALKKCMLQCDLAKFAHKTTDVDNMEEMESGVRSFIDATTPVLEAK